VCPFSRGPIDRTAAAAGWAKRLVLRNATRRRVSASLPGTKARRKPWRAPLRAATLGSPAPVPNIPPAPATCRLCEVCKLPQWSRHRTTDVRRFHVSHPKRQRTGAVQKADAQVQPPAAISGINRWAQRCRALGPERQRPPSAAEAGRPPLRHKPPSIGKGSSRRNAAKERKERKDRPMAAGIRNRWATVQSVTYFSLNTALDFSLLRSLRSFAAYSCWPLARRGRHGSSRRSVGAKAEGRTPSFRACRVCPCRHPFRQPSGFSFRRLSLNADRCPNPKELISRKRQGCRERAFFAAFASSRDQRNDVLLRDILHGNDFLLAHFAKCASPPGGM